MATGGGEKLLVWRDTEAVDLGLGMLDCARAYARQGLPKPDLVSVLGLSRVVVRTNLMVWS